MPKGRIQVTDKAFIITKGNAKKAIDGITKNIQAAIDGMVGITEQEVETLVGEIMADSNRRAPKDTGELVDSAFKVTDSQPDKTTFVFGYTDLKAPYQHELYDVYKNPTTPGTEPHFLLSALNEAESDILPKIASAIKSKTGG
jgi:hypothetical protein